MNRLRFLMSSLRARPMLSKVADPRIQRVAPHSDGPLQPFDNMPFDIPNRYVATVFFSFFFGVGFWSPFIIVWYAMAKKTL